MKINPTYFIDIKYFQHKLNKMAVQHLPPDFECGFCASRTESMRDLRDGIMAVPGWDDNKLCLFRIT